MSDTPKSGTPVFGLPIEEVVYRSRRAQETAQLAVTTADRAIAKIDKLNERNDERFDDVNGKILDLTDQGARTETLVKGISETLQQQRQIETVQRTTTIEVEAKRSIAQIETGAVKERAMTVDAVDSRKFWREVALKVFAAIGFLAGMYEAWRAAR